MGWLLVAQLITMTGPRPTAQEAADILRRAPGLSNRTDACGGCETERPFEYWPAPVPAVPAYDGFRHFEGRMLYVRPFSTSPLQVYPQVHPYYAPPPRLGPPGRIDGAASGAPDGNGCMLYDGEGPGRKMIKVIDPDDDTFVLVSAHRVAYVMATGDHCSATEDVAHACRNNGTDGHGYCVATDHLFKEKVVDLRRRQARTRHLNGLRRTFAGRRAS